MSQHLPTQQPSTNQLLAELCLHELLLSYYAKCSWSLEICLAHYVSTRVINPPAVLFTCLAFCKIVDKELPLSITTLHQHLGKAQPSSYQYTQVLRKLEENKRQLAEALLIDISHFYCTSHEEAIQLAAGYPQ